jgi:hypothetical protein
VLCQDEAGRLWVMLIMLRFAIRRQDGPEVRFGAHTRDDNREETSPLVRLKMVCEPADDGGLCITVLLPGEGGLRERRPDTRAPWGR